MGREHPIGKGTTLKRRVEWQVLSRPSRRGWLTRVRKSRDRCARHGQRGDHRERQYTNDDEGNGLESAGLPAEHRRLHHLRQRPRAQRARGHADHRRDERFPKDRQPDA
jgi:hypothetical protein